MVAYNKKTVWQERNKIKELIHISNRNRNMIKIGRNETIRHAKLKNAVCYCLTQLNLEFYTEAKLKNYKGRPDVICQNKKVYEVMSSEKDASIQNKELKYPAWLNIVPIKDKEDLSAEFGDIAKDYFQVLL